MPDPHLRAADSDRQAVAAVLGHALSEGRLTVEEYEERLGKAYAARTYADLEQLTTDLPRSAAAPRPAAGSSPAPGRSCAPAPWGRGLRLMWAPWLTTAIIVTAIWLATSLSSSGHVPFWPVWVILPWGAVLLARTLTGGAGRPVDRHRPPRDRYR